MKNTIKAVLFNALLFPGTGQLALKRKTRGWIYITLALICLLMFMSVIFNQVSQLASVPNVPADATVLTEMVTENMAENGGLAPLAVGGFILIWIVALIDAIFTGRRVDRANLEL